ncbi:MAG: hypothetical protein JJ992_07505, partial [Planctomycetes bacterium]|nr:hypothetical protein [Planctomycetota bacterium]
MSRIPLRCTPRVLIAVVAITILCPSVGEAEISRFLPQGELPKDRRLGDLKDLNGYFPFQVPATKDAWEQRSEALRRRVLVATG